ncbi:MAG: N-6 DNA methylase, partial [Verrucomicrobia bacterium]|nr:N-6 DNA methylase [Verrucomicrobiota bacterium]
AQDIHKIVDAFTKQLEIAKYARLVPVAEIEANDYNLNIPRYIDSTDPEDLQDIDAHLRGGIPNRDVDDLDRYWQVFPSVRALLFAPGDRPGYSRLQVAARDIKAAIFGHAEFTAFNQSVTARFEKWQTANLPILQGIDMGGKPKALIEMLSESLLDTFKAAPLLDAYDVYQHLMNYWDQTMQDDVYMIVSEGWKGANKLRVIIDDKDKKNKEKADLVVGKQKFKAELIPPTLLIAGYFSAGQAAIGKMEAKVAAITQAMDELKEEHGGEEGLLEEVKDDKGNIAKATVIERIKEIKDDKDAVDERQVLNDYLALIEQEAAANKQVKDATKALEAKVAAQYARLTGAEIKTLVVDDKWLATLAAAVQTELDRVSQALTGRIKQLAERYGTPLPRLTEEVQALAAGVDEHLKKMGAVWN